MAILIDHCDSMLKAEIEVLGMRAKERFQRYYSWKFVSDWYEEMLYREILITVGV